MTGDSSDAVDGVVDVVGDHCVLRFVRVLHHPVADVWAGLTRPEQLARWWGDADLDLVTGGRFVLRWFNRDDDGHEAVLHGTIRALEPPHLLEIAGDLHGTLRFELRPTDAGTELSFTSTVTLPEAFRTKVLAGWHFHLDALARFLDGGSTDLVHVAGWDAIHDRYERRAAG
jgi:uncharacterized protein YndB with AHSA1/START domain